MVQPVVPTVPAVATRSRVGKTLSIVAPCFNEQEVLDLFFARIDAELAAWGSTTRSSASMTAAATTPWRCC
jgi:hypothetical protein